MTSPIPGAALTAATDAVQSQPAGSSAAHLARVAVEAAMPELHAAAPPATVDIEWGVRWTEVGHKDRYALCRSEEDARMRHLQLKGFG
jgi:hypothetical protein